MDFVSDPEAAVAPLGTAGLLLAARSELERLGLPHPKVSEILDATGATRSRAYEIRDEISRLLPSLLRPPGRPRSEPAAAADVNAPSETEGLLREVVAFLMDYPGAVSRGAVRHRYADSFRRRILELRDQYAEMDLPRFAEATGVPQGTIEDWLRAGRLPPEEPSGMPNLFEEESPREEASLPKVETVLSAWDQWKGDFTHFCKHVRKHHRLDFGDSSISSILSLYGERRARPRPRRTPDEEALRDGFETFFPGAQWVGDGTPLEVTINGEAFGYNLELITDADTGAFLGTSVRDTEDSRAVTEAFDHAEHTAGETPLAFLLDNRPSNHTPEVDEALGETMRIRATPGRGQNKAHVEGGFGLFSQRLPRLALTTHDPRELGRQLLRQVAEVFSRALNNRPRHDRGGKSRKELYHGHTPTDQEREQAEQDLRDRLKKQERARKTREARLDPLTRELLDQAFERLDLIDPERHFRDAIARHPLDDIVDAIGIFEGKRERNTLPEGVDARYLLGIVRNVHHVHDAEAITEALLRDRLEARDAMLRPLLTERDALLEKEDLETSLDSFLDRALEAERTLDRLFWLGAAAERISAQCEAERPRLFRRAARRIHATFSASPRERFAAERSLIRRIWPLS